MTEDQSAREQRIAAARVEALVRELVGWFRQDPALGPSGEFSANREGEMLEAILARHRAAGMTDKEVDAVVSVATDWAAGMVVGKMEQILGERA